ncbi:MAG: HAMP domain-containing histidine kinase [Microscillaceae bacterium]|nr:HAMP domain-containing histidine kinase [Microscillaceae bacterium]
MKKQNLQIFIALIAIALVGLVALQAYWVNLAASVNHERFRQSVHKALSEVAHKLEQKEVLYLTNLSLREPQSLLQFLNPIDSLPPSGPSPGPDAVIASSLPHETTLPFLTIRRDSTPEGPAYQVEALEQSLSIQKNNAPLKETILIQDDRKTEKLAEIALPSAQHPQWSFSFPAQATAYRQLFDSLEQAFQPVVQKIEEMPPGQDVYLGLSQGDSVQNRIWQQKIQSRADAAFAFDQPLTNPLEHRHFKADSLRNAQNIIRIASKADIVSYLLEQLRTKQQKQDPQLRYAAIDSLLKAELTHRGITVSYEFMVEYRREEKSPPTYLFVEAEDQKSALIEKGYSVRLFPTEWYTAPSFLYVRFAEEQNFILKNTAWVLGSSLLLLGLVVFCFASAIHIILQQKKISEITHDFINNMTHELKTPIATVSLACEALQDPDLRQLPGKTERFLGMIKQENERLASQVEKVLQIALLDRGGVRLKMATIDVHQIIRQAVLHLGIHVENRGGHIQLDLMAAPSVAEADEVHLTNILLNLLDNANKYSPQTPQITVKTLSHTEGLEISVADQGQGMSREAQKKIFDKFYRVPTGNRHDVKGFGLGLSYVKMMIEAHQGHITVQSEPNKGSLFALFLPYQQKTIDY